MEKRKRDRDEYQRERYLMKKDRKMEKKREKMEKCYMGKEDVKALAATLAPPSPHVAFTLSAWRLLRAKNKKETNA